MRCISACWIFLSNNVHVIEPKQINLPGPWWASPRPPQAPRELTALSVGGQEEPPAGAPAAGAVPPPPPDKGDEGMEPSEAQGRPLMGCLMGADTRQ